MRTETDELEYVVVWFSVNQDQVWLDVTIPVVLPIPTERMIVVLVGQNLIMGQGRDDGDEVTLQRLPVRPLGFALVGVSSRNGKNCTLRHSSPKLVPCRRCETRFALQRCDQRARNISLACMAGAHER